MNSATFHAMSLGYKPLPIFSSLGGAIIVDTWAVNPAQSVHVYMNLALLVTKHMVTV